MNNNDLYGVTKDEDSDNERIYTTNTDHIVEDELITYLDEKRADRKVNIKHFNFIIYSITISL